MFRLIEEVSSSTLGLRPGYKADMSDHPLGLLQTTICASEGVFSIFISNPNKSENLLGRDAFKYWAALPSFLSSGQLLRWKVSEWKGWAWSSDSKVLISTSLWKSNALLFSAGNQSLTVLSSCQHNAPPSVLCWDKQLQFQLNQINFISGLVSTSTMTLNAMTANIWGK